MLRELTLDDALRVVRRMRDEDRRCMVAMMGDTTDEVYAINRFQSHGPAWTLWADEPVAICGLTLQSDWCAVMWFIATPSIGIHSYGKAVRLARTVLSNVNNPSHPEYRHRIEALTIDGWDAAARFVSHLGFQHEGVRRAAGSGGEDIHSWSIVTRRA